MYLRKPIAASFDLLTTHLSMMSRAQPPCLLPLSIRFPTRHSQIQITKSATSTSQQVIAHCNRQKRHDVRTAFAFLEYLSAFTRLKFLYLRITLAKRHATIETYFCGSLTPKAGNQSLDPPLQTKRPTCLQLTDHIILGRRFSSLSRREVTILKTRRSWYTLRHQFSC